jgi:LPXTG-motif cell wall-anchored protein
MLGAAAIAVLILQLGIAAPAAWADDGAGAPPPASEATTAELDAAEATAEEPADETSPATDVAEPPADTVDAPADAEPAPDVAPAVEPAVGEEAAADEDAAAAEDAEPEVGVLDVRPGVIFVSFDLDRVSLVNGRAYGETKGTASGVPTNVSDIATNAFHVNGTFNDDAATGIDMSAVFQVAQLGQPTDNWVLTRVYEWRGAAYAECTVYLGDPAAGGVRAEPSPFTCAPDYGQSFPNAKIGFDIAMNRDAEASGIINTLGSVSLLEGTYETEPLPYHVDGTAEVAKNSSTSFDIVLRAGDQPILGPVARSLFVYRIADEGVQTQFYIVGYSQNFRGTTKFSPESRCGVYDGDPRTSGTPLSEQTPAVATPYTCEVTSDRWIGWRGHHEATFAVAPRPMTTIADPIQQKELIAKHCSGDAVHCGFALATVTDTVGKGRIVSGILNNTTDKDTSSTYGISGSESVTIGGGFEITVGFEYTTLFGKISGSLKTSFNRSVSNTTSTVNTYVIPVPAHHKGWLEATPPMVHTEGTIIVYDGSRYFKLTNVFADFPDATRQWEYTIKNQPIVGAEPTDPGDGSVDPPLDGLTPGLGTVVAGSGGTAGVTGVRASRLAATGGDDPFPMLAGATGLMVAGGLLLLLRRRRAASH